MVNYYVDIEIYNDYFYLDASTYSYGGPILIDLALEPANYTVYLRNYFTGQYAYFDWNISSRDPNKMSRINATVEDYKLYVEILDSQNMTIIGSKQMYVNGSYYDSFNSRSYEIYSLGEGVYTIDLFFEDINHMVYSSNTTFVIDIKNTINVNDSFYNTTVIKAQIMDLNGNPMNDTYVHFYVGDELYANATDENGYATYDLNLLPGKYEVRVLNPVSSQSKRVTMEVLEEYDYKQAFINITRDGYKFTFNVTDINGNGINGRIRVTHDYGTDNVLINNGTGIYIYEDLSGEYVDEKVDITFLFISPNYYPTYEFYAFDVVNTIISSDVISNTIFNVTVYGLDKKPLIGKEVLFTVHDDVTYRTVKNVTVVTDANGVASIEIDAKPFTYKVITKNLETYQSTLNYWINKDIVEITPVVDYVDEATGFLYLNGHSLVFRFSPDNACTVVVGDDDYHSDEFFIEDGIIEVYLPELKRYDLTLHYMGDYYMLETFRYYTVIAGEMSTPNMTISQDLVVDYLGNANFKVNLSNGSKPISNASVEIMIGDNKYCLLTDNEGNINLPISLNAGKYDVFVNYKGSPLYVHVNKTTTLTVNKVATSVATSKVTTVYGTSKNLVVTLKDAKGNSLAGKTVSVKLNGKTYNRVTDKNGRISIAVPKTLAPKTYTAAITFGGDNNYVKSTGSAKVIVNKAKSKIIAKKKTFRVNAKTKKYIITLKSGKKAIKKARITLKMKGKTYKAKTNVKGKATFKIKLTKKGAFKATIKFKGNKYYKAATKKVKIKMR